MRQISVFCSVILAIVWACEPITERKQPPPSLYQLSQSDLDLSGEQLAKGYCAACHLMPDPSVLDKKTWTTLLPDMRKRMGLYLEEDFGTAMPEDEGGSRRDLLQSPLHHA